jgi:hypothetical protein
MYRDEYRAGLFRIRLLLIHAAFVSVVVGPFSLLNRPSEDDAANLRMERLLLVVERR